MQAFTHKTSRIYKWEKYTLLFSLFLLLISGIVRAQSPVSVVIGNTSGTKNWFYGPIYRNTGNTGTLNYSRYAYIYTAAELTAAGVPSGAKIVKLEWLKADGGSIAANNTFNVWMSNTTTATLPTTASWGSLVTGNTQVYGSSSFSLIAGSNVYVSAPFNLPPNDSFTYSGSNLMILTDWAKFGTQTGTGINFYVSGASGKSIGISSNAAMSSTSVLQAASYGNNRPTMRITYVTVPACSGVPTTGPAISSVSSACAGTPFTLSIQNTIPGTGVTFLWQRSDNQAFTQNVSSIGTSSNITISETTSSYYRCIASCSASGLNDTSAKVSVPLSPHYNCYCVSMPSSTADEDIFNVTFGSLNNSSNCTTTAAGPGSSPQLYSNYQYLTPPNVEKLSTVPFSVQIGTCLNSYPNRTAIFIDYNQNSVFDANEQVYSSPTALSGAHIESGSIVIPAWASTGLTGMRVITSETSVAITNPCLTAILGYSWGETEDYLINITPTTLCTGAPTPGNTMSNQPTVCPGKTANLSLQNLMTGQGVSYQWYRDNSLISGATSYAYTSASIVAPTTFYCAVTCNNSGLVTNSTPITITMSSFIECYCASGAASDADDDIFDFTFNGTYISTDCNTAAPGPGSILGRYSNFHTLGNIDTVLLGQKVPFIIHSDDCDQAPYYSFGTAIWIDFNQNGSFNDPGEQVFVEQNPLEGPRYIIDSVKIPCSALEGPTGMRITIAEQYSGPLLTPCLNYSYGETEDYIIYIKQPDTCGFTPTFKAGNVQATVAYFCDSTTTVVSMQNKCFFNNYTYQWYKNNVAIPGATNTTYSTPMIYNSTTYSCIVTCNNNGVITRDTTAPLTILKSIPTVSVQSNLSSYCTGGTPVSILSTGALNYTYSPSAGLSSTTGALITATPSATTTYTVTGTNVYGCTNTSVITINKTTLPVDLTASSTSYCYPGGSPVTLTAASANATQFSFAPSLGLSADTGSITIAAPLTTTSYIVTASDSTGCSGKDTVTITAFPCTTPLAMKLFIQAYYDFNGYMRPAMANQGVSNNINEVDSLTIELHNPSPPYSVVQSQIGILQTNGNVAVNFTSINGYYYIVIRHRNALETWSALPVNINDGFYDFTTSASQAFGDNQILVDNGTYALYSADLNGDQNADLMDMSILEIDASNFEYGYLNTDLNGDGNVDLLDVPFLEFNVGNFIFSNHP